MSVKPTSKSGMAVDASGGPVVDPTANVIALTEAANKRQDDLRTASEKLMRAELDHAKETLQAMEKHQRELDKAESDRLNSIRQVDREEVSKTAVNAQTAITTLANTTNTLAETLRNQVATMAAAVENRQNAYATDVNKRLSALELSSSEGKGKQGVAEPQLERLAQVVEKLAARESLGTGKSQGVGTVWAIILGCFAILGVLVGLAGLIFALAKH